MELPAARKPPGSPTGFHRALPRWASYRHLRRFHTVTRMGKELPHRQTAFVPDEAKGDILPTGTE